jgi:SPP1 gp7 family putative phage head morphogenesis protein
MSLACCHGKVRSSVRKQRNPSEWVATQRQIAPRMRKFENLILRFFDMMSNAITDKAIREAVASGDPGPILAPFAGLEKPNPQLVTKNVAELEAEITDDIANELYAIAGTSGTAAYAALDKMPGVRVSGRFNIKNPYTGPAIQERVAWLVSEVRNGVNEGLRQGIADVVNQSYIDGAPPKAVVRRIRPMIGLLDGQINALEKYREKLVEAGTTGKEINRLVDREAKKKKLYRANMIARTELARASSQGRHDAWKAGRDEGLFKGRSAYVEWVAGLSERTCEYCAALHGSRQPLGEVFIAEPVSIPEQSLESETPPIHPMCRCTTILVLEE